MAGAVNLALTYPLAGGDRRHPIALRPDKGQLSRRIGRERTVLHLPSG